MKTTRIHSALLVAVAALTVVSASALGQQQLTTYSDGDLFLGLRRVGSPQSIAINLGSAKQFLPASLGGNSDANPFRVPLGRIPATTTTVFSLNNELVSVFGANWSANPVDGSGVRWAVVGSSGNTSSALDGFSRRTIFVTAARTQTNSQGLLSPVGIKPDRFDIGDFDEFSASFNAFAQGAGEGSYKNQRGTANNAAAYVGAASDANNWGSRIDSVVPGTFGLGANAEVEQTFGANSGPTDSVLDLWISPGTGSSRLTTNTYLGSFTLRKSGDLIYWPSSANPPLPQVTVLVSPINGSAGTFFQYQISANNFPTAYGASNLPTGLSLDPVSGLISGTPTQPATNDVTLTASNPFGSSSATLKLVFGAGPAPSPAPQVTSESVSATVGRPFSYNIKANNSATSYSAAGLPPGLSIDAKSGRISGTPRAGGKRNVAITASNASGSGSGLLTLNVGKGSQSITFTQPPLQTFRKGNTFRLVASTDSRLPVTFVSSNPQIVSVRGSIATILKPGTVRIVARQSGNVDYLPAREIPRNVVVSQSKPQTITFTQPPNQTFRKGKTFRLVASANSRLAVTFVSSNPQIVSVRGNVATILKPGTVRIVARQSGNATFAPAKDIPRTVVIRK